MKQIKNSKDRNGNVEKDLSDYSSNVERSRDPNVFTHNQGF